MLQSQGALDVHQLPTAAVHSVGLGLCCLQARRRARSPSSDSDADVQAEDDEDYAEALAAEEAWGRPQRRAAQNANKALKVCMIVVGWHGNPSVRGVQGGHSIHSSGFQGCWC
jgi:hypothetical protein